MTSESKELRIYKDGNSWCALLGEDLQMFEEKLGNLIEELGGDRDAD